MAKLRGLRPIDDDFMRCIFRDNEPLAQLVLRIVLKKDDLIVEHVETQAGWLLFPLFLLLSLGSLSG